MVAIDPANMTVTLNMINGFGFGNPVWYMSMDASIPLAAAIEHNTFAPLMAAQQCSAAKGSLGTREAPKAKLAKRYRRPTG